jgi:uncharacterized protein YvpB
MTRARRRVRLVPLAAVLLGVAGFALAGRADDERGSEERDEVVLTSGGAELRRIDVSRFRKGDELNVPALANAVRRRLPRTQIVRKGRARLTFELDRNTAAGAVARLEDGRGTIDVPRRAVASKITAPIVKQRLRNNCESAALSALLATAGIREDQLALQRQLPRSGSLDPQGSGPTMVWGDPERGYVGRPEGGGLAGGFGVYEGPVAAVAARNGKRLQDISGSNPAVVYRMLLEGRPVMTWVGLQDGPYGTWRSPEGRNVRVNFGEHTVVLFGIRRDGALRVMNPLSGAREVWTKQVFETMWARLDRRALAA